MLRTERLMCISAIVFGSALAHEGLTHQNIGNVVVAYLQQSPQYSSRPLLANLQQALLIGAVQEDDAPLPVSLGGQVGASYRYFFHFLPNLSYAGVIDGSCTSIEWGLEDTQCVATCGLLGVGLPGVCAIASASAVNTFRWDEDLTPDSTGAPSAASVQGLSYVVHLLEDLGSPPHTRNDMHSCAVGLIYCDPFETDNNGRTPTMPTGTPTISTAGFTAPEQYFQALQTYVSSNYYSNNTAFAAGMSGPAAVPIPDDRYFYGACIPGVSTAAGTCESINGLSVRKIAHKGPLYWAFYSAGIDDPTKAGIDSAIAQEQFSELGPVIVQHVAAFIQFYAPAVSVTVQGAGSGTITSTPGNLNCGSGTCTALFVQGSTVFLTATPASGSTFLGWGGACASAGIDTIAQVTLTSDSACTATFGNFDLTIAGASCQIGPYPGYPYPRFVTQSITVSGTATGPGSTSGTAAMFWVCSGSCSILRYPEVLAQASCGGWTQSGISYLSGCQQDIGQPVSITWQLQYFRGLYSSPIPDYAKNVAIKMMMIENSAPNGSVERTLNLRCP